MLELVTELFNAIQMFWDAIPWHWVVIFIHTVLAPFATVHAMLYKRDSRAALGWASISLFFPVAGPFVYFVFGVNRIHTQAKRLSAARFLPLRIGYERGTIGKRSHSNLFPENPSKQYFSRVSDRLTNEKLLPGNQVQLLRNGDEAYPAMLNAIENAESYIFLTTYIFETDQLGRSFIDALIAAKQRGVEANVIIDGIGEKYSFPRARGLLRKGGVTVERFLPPKIIPPTLYINMRNHRKILVVDGEVGFTGGMNIGGRHLVVENKKNPTADIHFQVKGPVVKQLQTVFEEDWMFVAKKPLAIKEVDSGEVGSDYCRCIGDGPNKDLDKISLSLKTAIATAREEIIMMTPYFLPSREMVSVLQSASLRGVKITIILPEKSNLRFVDWATRNLLWELLQYDIEILFQPGPFAHSKLLLADKQYAQVGSANIDPRSLRLNFELNMEVMGDEIIQTLHNYLEKIISQSKSISLDEVDNRSLPVRIRDAFFWLFMPYL